MYNYAGSFHLKLEKLQEKSKNYIFKVLIRINFLYTEVYHYFYTIAENDLNIICINTALR